MFVCGLALSARPAHGQTRCFQNVGGVPGAYTQPPNWWDSGTSPLGSLTGRFVDDPRWRGATEYSHVGNAADFKVLVETTATGRNLVMSWHVRADPPPASGTDSDRLYVGFWDDATAQGIAFRIEKAIDTATPVSGSSYDGHNGTPSGAFVGRFFHKVGATGSWLLNNSGGSIVPPLPTWLKNDTRVDIFCPSGTCNEWAVRMHIPLRAPTDHTADVTLDDPTGVQITTGGTFRFWYQVQDDMHLGQTALYSWPEAASVAAEGNPPCTAIPPNCLPDPNDATTPWNLIQDGSTCNGDIGFEPGHIYANTMGSIQVNLSTPNVFHAQPTNFMSSAQPGTGIKATFRIANWGSAVGVSPDWLPICTDQVGTAGSVTPNHQFDIACTWSVPNPCDFRPVGVGCGNGSRTTDQCLLVDLAAASGGGPYLFSPASAYQNMMFTGASRVVKTAALDIKALPALAGGGPNRDLYVYVKTQNMPAKAGSDTPAVAVDVQSQAAREKLGGIELPKTGAIGREVAGQIAAASQAGRLSFDEVQAVMPTYVAYVWHDTGKTIQSGAGTRKVLASQPSFGMFTWHDGGLNGWRHTFEGQNVVEIGPSFYRISVPEGGSTTVTTRVTACEWPLCLDHEASPLMLWVIVIILLLILIVIVALAMRRRTTP
jgi:hypothetical protein